MTTPRDILDLPDAISKSAWVVRLTEAIQDPERSLREYAITADIKLALDDALRLVGDREAVRVRGSDLP